jgi:endonuclease/exonuclease/phosphatase family metal-dependent hydrolase
MQVRVCSFNGEWMNDWFVPGDHAQFRATFSRDGHTNSTDKTAQRTARLLRAIDADVVGLEEAPSCQEELDLFLAKYLSVNGVLIYRGICGDSGGAQKLAVIFKPETVTLSRTPSSEIPTLVNAWQCDTDGDGVLNEYAFTRTPLTVDVSFSGGQSLRLIVMHTKSNFINDGKKLWNDPATRQNYVTAALTNRRRISAEGMRVRCYLDQCLDADPASRVIVMGDLNDGPGRDYFEDLYLTHNVTDTLVGSAFEPEKIFTHALHSLPSADRYTCVFDDFVTDEKDKHVLLDHVILSPGLTAQGPGLRFIPGSGRIHHQEYCAEVQGGGKHREDRPSDHRPVSVELQQ